MKTLRCVLFLALSTVVGSGVARAIDTVPAVVSKARAFVGSEAALDGVKSIHYTGTIETQGEGADAGKQVSLKIELIFQKPCQQRVVITHADRIEISCLDDYEGWQRRQDLKDSKNWVMTLMKPDQLRMMRASTWENLSFFRGIEKRGGHIEDRGETDVDGVKCRKLAYVYRDTIEFVRYFATDTGRLVLTETDETSKVREVGEIRVNGLRFPKQIVTTNPVEGGPDRVVTLTFTQIKVNEVFPGSLFQVPPPGK